MRTTKDRLGAEVIKVEQSLPYLQGVARLDEGPRILADITGASLQLKGFP